MTKLWKNGRSEISIGENKADGVGIFFKNHDVDIIRRRDIIPDSYWTVFIKVKNIALLTFTLLQMHVRNVSYLKDLKRVNFVWI